MTPADHPVASRATDLDWFELADRLRSGMPLFLPVGSTEQHGPHLPLSTDAVVAEALASGVAARCGGAVLPVITYGAPSRPRSGGGDGFPAPDVPLPTLIETVESVIGKSLAAGAQTIVVISWHWENASVLWDALRQAHADHGGSGRSILFGEPWELMDSESVDELLATKEGIFDWASDHAGLLETALMLHLAPDLVSDPPPPMEFRPRRYEVLPTPADAVPSTGVVHDARGVTAAQGARCFESMVAGMDAAIASESAS